ncbi:TIGR00300 family protein [Brevibacillus composti]|uniref:ornithine cyclodeaminase n=1 Tax=Brevibacillus composti TaxID=2796470 RepID=A0A7T5JPK4_9BACL|nr:TIGR00300 family protein [Brevibacillus composti]QQE75272.1 TIGR00300 family protein [Brevibacillus composti]QUO42299.1 TIGR00300 family protein [Brevibacillus composti]
MERVIELRGHIIRDNILKLIDASVVQYNGRYRVLELSVGDQVDDESVARVALNLPEDKVELILNELINLGCVIPTGEEAPTIKLAEKDKVVPDDFYSTTNHATEVFLNGKWVRAKYQRMDACLVVKGDEVHCVKLRDIKKDDQVICGSNGVRLVVQPVEQQSSEFSFMSNEVSSERRVEVIVKQLAEEMRGIRERNGRIVFVAGPVVIHTGGQEAFQNMIRSGYVNALLSGNALAVHDIERALFGTSLGVNLDTGSVVRGGHKNHMRAINAINRSGSIAEAVADGTLQSGIMYECVKHQVPFVLAGSIRDDGPLPDTLMDLIEAQAQYAEQVADAEMVVMLSTMLHAIGTGNMMPSWIKTVCVDINPAVVTKLMDRGSAQTVGVVTDVGLFLTMLDKELNGKN